MVRRLADTAEQQLMVNFHGSTIPHGIERTWPHVLTMEAVRGAEDYHFGYLTPRGNVMLPFTRNVVGSMDYIPRDVLRGTKGDERRTRACASGGVRVRVAAPRRQRRGL